MANKKLFIIPLFLILLFCKKETIYGQCNQQNVKASNYINGNCNNMRFQGIVGSINTSYGECSGLNFDSPLTGGDQTSSIHPIILDLGVQVFPNPTFGDIVISLPDDQIYSLQLFSSIGQIIKSEKLKNQGNHIVSINDFPSGYYIIKIQVANKIQISKTIKL